jgi:uncharacterized membrane protein
MGPVYCGLSGDYNPTRVRPDTPFSPLRFCRRSAGHARQWITGRNAIQMKIAGISGNWPMKYTVQIDIDLPRDKVVELFDNTENLYKWQKGLQSFEHLSGEPGQPGATSRLKFKMGKRNIEMIETITLRELPDRFDGTYDTAGVFNIVKNTFQPLDDKRTRWLSENEFRFSGFMRIIGFLMKGAFPKQSLKYMQDFKAFAERGADVRKSA